MTNLLDLQGKLTNFANHSYKKHSFLKEWRVFIVLTLVLKIAAMIFSVFAGFFYFENLLVMMLNNRFWAVIFAVIALLLIEVLTAISLSKFFKFAIRFEIKKAIPILILSGVFFSISFISSTNGLALRQSRKIDNTTAITAKYNDEKRQLEEKHAAVTARMSERLAVIKKNPQGWINGRRCVLTSTQMEQVSGCYDEIKFSENNLNNDLAKLKESFNLELESNSKTTENEAEKYYKIVSIIMVIIFLINGLLMFFYSKIFSETNKDAEAIEAVDDFTEKVNKRASTVIEKNISETMQRYLSALGITYNEAKIEPLTKQNNNNDNDNQIESKRLNVVGFRPNKNDSTAAVEGKKDWPQCPYCGERFEKTVWNKKYCCDDHKMKAWEARNGRKVPKKRKK